MATEHIANKYAFRFTDTFKLMVDKDMQTWSAADYATVQEYGSLLSVGMYGYTLIQLEDYFKEFIAYVATRK